MRISIPLSNCRGDTIVEVLIAIAIISLALTGAYNSANRSIHQAQDSQERAEALKVTEQQVEILRQLVKSDPNSIFGATDRRLFCFDEQSNVVVFTSATNLPHHSDDDYTAYPETCRQVDSYERYSVSIDHDPAQEGLFTFRSRWERIGGGRNEVMLMYRVHPAIARAPISPPPDLSVPPECNDVNMPGTYYYRFNTDSYPDLGYHLDDIIGSNYNATPSYGFSLPPGNYRVWLYSWDYHLAPTLDQTNESWFVRMYYNDGHLDTPPISDMPSMGSNRQLNYDGSVNGQYQVEEVSSNIHIPHNVTNIQARHAGPLKESGTANSIRAVCASFSPI
jgi:prepilin-type N-terminal cleavage/methylation domain-containing protein